jgi:hypothetical protein
MNTNPKRPAKTGFFIPQGGTNEGNKGEKTLSFNHGWTRIDTDKEQEREDANPESLRGKFARIGANFFDGLTGERFA